VGVEVSYIEESLDACGILGSLTWMSAGFGQINKWIPYHLED
jgi:hypothetical protein